jgi:hypothetical protein
MPSGPGDESPRGLGGEALGPFQTDPDAAAGDDGDFVSKFSVHKRFLFRLC